MVLPGAFFSWSTLLAVGAGCARVPPVSHGGLRCLPCRVVRTWKTGHFYFALVSFSLFWRLGVACGVQRRGFFGRSCVHLTWFDSGYMFFEGFYVAVNSNPEAFALHSCRMENCAQPMLLVAASLSAGRTLEVDSISTSAPFLTVCGNFRCSLQHFSGPSMMKNSSSSRAHAN